MLGNLFQSLVDRRIKILLTTLAAYPGGYTINIDRMTLEMKPGLDDMLFHYPLTEFAHIRPLFPHLSLTNGGAFPRFLIFSLSPLVIILGCQSPSVEVSIPYTPPCR